MPAFQEIAHTVALAYSVFIAFYMYTFQAEFKLITGKISLIVTTAERLADRADTQISLRSLRRDKVA